MSFATNTRLLVIEDDQYFRQVVVNILKKNGFQVDEAPDGRVAKNIILTSEYDGIISDVQMPHFSGVELLEWCKGNASKAKFILMTGFSHVLETLAAESLGADAFLAKPFHEKDLNDALEICFQFKRKAKHIIASQEEPNLDAQFCKVSIREFVSDKVLEYPIFIRVNSEKYIKLSHKGGKIEDDRVKKFEERGLHFLYIRKEDFKNHVGFNLGFAKLVSKSKVVSPEKRMSFMKHTGEVLLESAFVNGVDERSFNESKDFVTLAMEALSEDSDFYNMLTILNEHSDVLYAHSLGVSIYSVMISRELGWNASSTLFKLSMGGLFHDIGKKEIDRVLLEKPRPLLSQAERTQIETHVIRGKEILEALKKVPEDVIQIVYQHHEDCLGQGFPRGIQKNDIHPLAKVVSVANVFCEYAIRSTNHEGMSAQSAIINMDKFKKDSVDRVTFDALKRCISKEK